MNNPDPLNSPTSINRRDFLAATAGLAAIASVANAQSPTPPAAPPATPAAAPGRGGGRGGVPSIKAGSLTFNTVITKLAEGKQIFSNTIIEPDLEAAKK